MTSFDLDQLRYSPDAAASFYQRVLDAASRLPDVEAVGLARPTSVWTFGRGKGPGSVIVWAPGREAEVVIGGYAGGDLFGAIGLRVAGGPDVHGRGSHGPTARRRRESGVREKDCLTGRPSDKRSAWRMATPGRQRGTGRGPRGHDRRRRRISRRTAVHAAMAAPSARSTFRRRSARSLRSRSTCGAAERPMPSPRRFEKA